MTRLRFFSGNVPMSSLVRNLRIGTKLAIASALGFLLVLAMIASQIVGNGNVRRSNQAALAQLELARDAVEAKLAVRSMQLAVRDIRLANGVAELKKAGDALVERLGTLTKVADGMSKLSLVPENRARMEKLKTLGVDYLNAGQRVAAVRSEAIAAGSDAARVA